MKRLIALAAFAALSTTTAWAVISAPAASQPATGHEKHFDACARVCADTQLQCDTCFKYCLTHLTAGKTDHAASAQLCTDCGDCCKLCATLCAHQSTFCPACCEFCARCCDECATGCEKSAHSPEMKACAEACRKCSASCREMVKMVAQK